MIKGSWTTLIVFSLLMLIFCVPVVNAETLDEVIPKESFAPQSQADLAEIFMTFSEINTALDGEIQFFQTIIDDYTNGRTTPGVTNNNLLKLNESIMNTRSKTFSLKFTGKYEEDKIQLIRTCDMLDQSLKDMKIAVGLRNTDYYTKSKQELQDAIQFKDFIWKQLNKDLNSDGYIRTN